MPVSHSGPATSTTEPPASGGTNATTGGLFPPVRSEPYQTNSPREDADVRRERLAEDGSSTASSSSTDGRPSRRKRTSGSVASRPSTRASARLLERASRSTAPSGAATVATPESVAASDALVATREAPVPVLDNSTPVPDAPAPAPDAQMLTDPPPPTIGPSTQPASLAQSQEPALQTVATADAQPSESQQVPLHLVQPKMLPHALLQFIRGLYLSERRQLLTDEGVRSLWTDLDNERRIVVVDLYGKSTAQAHIHASDEAFTAKLKANKANTSKGSFYSQASQDSIQDKQPAPVVASPSIAAVQFVRQNSAAANAFSGSSTSVEGGVDISRTQSFVSTGESEPSLGFEDMEEDYMFDEDSGRILAAHKGKERAVEMDITDVDGSVQEGDGQHPEHMDFDDADFDVDGRSGAATPTPRQADVNSGEPSDKGFGAGVDSELVLMFVRKVDGLGKTIRDQADFLRELSESNRAFQMAIMEELRSLRGQAGPARPAAPPEALPRAAAAIQKVMERSAKARGKELNLTPEAVEKIHRTRQMSRMHGHMRTLLQINDSTDLVVLHPTLTEEQASAYLAGDKTFACTAENFHVDLIRGWKAFSLNKHARLVLIRSFQKKAQGGAFAMNPPPKKMLTDEFLGGLIDQYMITLRRAYRAHQNPKTEEEKAELRRRAARNARMGTSYRSRLYVVVHLGYGRHSILFARMVACHMSGDETDGDEVKHPPTYRIIIAEWQSLELRAFLWTLDAKYIAHWEKPPKNRRTGGNPPRVRDVRDESKTIPGIAPCRLWRNCYNPEWLEKLEDWEIELLEIVNEDYDFTLDPPAATSGQASGQKATGKARSSRR